MNNQQVLIAHNLISISSGTNKMPDEGLVGTLLGNMAYYGFVPSLKVVNVLQKLTKEEMTSFWTEAKAALEVLTGADKGMSEFVVYKNFPKEVLEMSQAQYWISQILMYWGFANENFTQPEKKRENMVEKLQLKTLHLADEKSLTNIYEQLQKNASRWSDSQTQYAQHLFTELKISVVNVDSFAFKENGVTMAKLAMENQVQIKLSNATDVLRLAALVSGGDVALRENFKFKKFKRSERRQMLSWLEQSSNLQEDCTRRPELWKRFLSALHPGDYKFTAVQAAYNTLYKKEYITFASAVQGKVESVDASALHLLETRPGEFVRKLHQMYEIFDMLAIESFIKVIPELTSIQLLKLDKYVLSINARQHLIYPPKGNWSKAQFVSNDKKAFSVEALAVLRPAISTEMSKRLNALFPQGVDMEVSVDNIKLQTNDQKLASYGRGTSFAIPENAKFVRTASYWAHSEDHNTYFDNGWNFFDESWGSKGSCCWNSTDTQALGAVFSGDPTNSKDMQGRACQMIDLDLEKLQSSGVRYAVWNILCFSGVAFDDAKEVMGTLQWGEDAQKGNLYEPSRAQMVFPVTGKSMTKYIAYLDLMERKVVYMDANLAGDKHSAVNNEKSLPEKMPAFLEYLNSLPSVADVFVHCKKGSMPVWFTDEGKNLEEGSQAYVFKPVNANNHFKQINLSKVLE